MEKVYNLLKKLIKAKRIEDMLSIIFKQYTVFIKLNSLNSIDNDKLDISRFELNMYNKGDYSNDNLYMMFEIFHKNFINAVEKVADRSLSYKSELSKKSLSFEKFSSSSKYIVLATNTELKLNIFKAYLLIYYVESRINRRKNFMGIDFEFNTKKIALMQINFEQANIKLLKNSFIALFNPNQLDKNWRTFFVQKILCSDDSFKIFHGSDSLDIPYLYDELLDGNKTFIKRFTKNFIDTKFLCEYNYYRRGSDLGKCKIYYVLFDENVIDNQKLEYLHKNEEGMGPLYDIFISIDSLNDFLINYTLYDVLYLHHLVYNFRKKIDDFDLIVDLTQFTFLEKRKVSEYLPVLEINKINNYMITMHKGETARLNDIFNQRLEKITLNKRSDIFNQVLKINYFKSDITMLLKFIIYQELVKNNTIFVNLKNKEIYDKELLNYNLDFLSSYKSFCRFIKNIVPF